MNLHNEMITYGPYLRIYFFLIVLTLVACSEMPK